MVTTEVELQVDGSSAAEDLPTNQDASAVTDHHGGHQGLLARLRCHGLRALSNTSAHGFNRLAVSGNWLARVVWIAVIAGGMGMFTFHVYTLVSRYQSKPTSVRYVPNYTPFDTPDIYVCPMKPISELKLFLRNITDIQQKNRTEQIIKDMTKLYNTHDLNWSEITRSINLRELQEAACLSVEGIFMRRKGHIRRIVYHPTHICCAVIYPDMSLYFSEKGKIDLSIFVDNSDHPEIQTPFLDMVRQERRENGVQIYIVPKKHYPDDDSTSVIVSPGFTTHIVLTQTTLVNHPQKQSCTKNPDLVPIVDVFTMKSSKFFYTPEMCLERKNNVAQIKSSNCFFSTYYCMEEYQNYTRCDNRSIYNKTIPRISLTRKEWHSCEKYKHCTNTLYEAKLFMYKIKNVTEVFEAQTTFPSSWPVRNWSFKGQNASTNAKLVMNTFLDNYMQVRFSVAKHGATYIVEDLSYPLTNLFSDIGGILGLYIGISALTLFELVEILVTMAGIVCETGCRKRRETH